MFIQAKGPPAAETAGIEVYVGSNLSSAICYFADPAAKERIVADHAEQRLDFAVRKQILWESETATVSEVLAMERKLIVETGLTGVLFKCT